MKTKYLTPDLLKEELYTIDVITASGEASSGSSSSSSSSSSQAEVDNAIRAFSAFRN
jgi:hypothetical protein